MRRRYKFEEKQPEEFANLKAKVNSAFAAIRKHNLLARQNYMCCMGCALAAFPSDNTPKNGAVYFHRQDGDRMRDSGDLTVRFTSFDGDGKPTTEGVGAIAADAFRSAGLVVDWNGTAGD